MDIVLHNSKTRKKERLTPLDPSNVRMYVCGPTVYDRAHLGNSRPAIVFDVLFRLLRHVYGADHVTYVRNFTDVDDKINARAVESGVPISEITAMTTAWYLEDMAAVGVMEPTHMPRATGYIGEMIAMIEALIARGHAYAADGHVLFSVESWPEHYGALSGRSVDDMIAGARVDVAPYKRGPMDFVLWKPSPDDLPGWESPWGRGRPGWHIECSAMAKALLGEVFDIHGGGNDLMFPHHENEIAQSCCANGTDQMAQIWLHNEMLQVEGKKMSKSLGNFFTVRDLLDQGIPGEVIRFVMLSTHYRKPMDWTADKAEAARKTLAKWRQLIAGVQPGAVPEGVVAALADDLNTAGAIAELHRWAEAIRNATATEEGAKNFLNVPEDILQRLPENDAAKAILGMKAGLAAGAQLMGLLTDELGAWFPVIVGRGLVGKGVVGKATVTASKPIVDAVGTVSGSSTSIEDQLTKLAAQLDALRTDAMATKDFSAVDALKAALLAAGVEVRMSKAGVELLPGPGFDAEKLEGVK